MGRIGERRAGERSGLEVELRLGGGEPAVLGHPHLDPGMGAGDGAGGAQHLVPRQDDLHRPVGLAREQDRHGFGIEHGLAAETATQFRLGDADPGDVHLEDSGEARAEDEMTLGAAPELGLAVLGEIGDAGLGLDIALVHGLGVEFALDDDVGLGEPGIDIAHGEFLALQDVGRPVGRRVHPLGHHVLEQDRRIGLDRVHDVDDVGQDLVVDLDQFQRLLGDPFAGRRHRRHRMAVVEGLFPRHAVATDVAEFARRQFGKIVPRDDRLDAGKRRGARGIDGLDDGMGMGRTQHLADQHPRQVGVGAELRPAGDLVDAIGLDRGGADDLQFAVRIEP